MKSRRAPVVEHLVSDISERIRQREFEPGSPLPSIRRLAAEYRASPRTVELALRQLCEGRKLLRHLPRRGFRVLQSREAGRLIAVFHQDYGQIDRRPALTAVICRELRQYGYRYQAFDLRVAEPDIGGLAAAGFAGVISARYAEYDYHDRLLAAGLLHVVACRENDVPAPSSFIDHAELVAGTMRMLYEMGHRKIALLVRNPKLYFYPKAIRAYRETAKTLKLSWPDAYLGVMQFGSELGSQVAVQKLLELPERPEAIIACRDYQCRGAFLACREHGLTVGRDISIIGYDDSGWPEGREFLTTYREPYDELGAAAVGILHDLLTGREKTLLQREIIPPLFMRQSVAPILRYLEET